MRTAVLVCMMCIPTIGQAAVVQISGTAVLETPIGTFSDNKAETIDTADGPASGSVEGFVGFSGDGLAGGASGSASFDIAKGELKAVATHDPVTSGLDGGTAGAYAIIYEQFIASGNGTVTLKLQVNGSWSYSGCDYVGPPNCIAASAGLGFTSPFQQVEKYFSNDVIEGTTPYAFSETLETTLSVTDGNNYGIVASLFALVGQGTSGTVDMGSTAYLTYLLSDGLSISFADSRFLSSPSVPIGEIPLPLGAPLLLSGFVLLLGIRKRGSM